MNSKTELLSDLPNIGKILSDKLIQVGINTPQALKSIGSEDAFVRLKTVDVDACLSTLCALEGAVRGIRWHDLEAGRKMELKVFHKNVQAVGT